MGFGGGAPSMPAIEPPPPLPKETDPEIERKRKEEEARIRKMKGRRRTILTGPEGLPEEPELERKKLLGL